MMPVIGYLIWLAVLQAWLDALAPPPRPRPPRRAADIVDLARWRADHAGSGPSRGGRAA
jgi:hypothetical protein